MGDTIFDILKLLEGLVITSASEANVVTIGKNANIFIIGSEGNIYTFHPYEDVFLKDLTDKNDKINYLKLKFIDDEKVKALLCSNNYKHIELSPDGSMLLLYSTTKIGFIEFTYLNNERIREKCRYHEISLGNVTWNYVNTTSTIIQASFYGYSSRHVLVMTTDRRLYLLDINPCSVSFPYYFGYQIYTSGSLSYTVDISVELPKNTVSFCNGPEIEWLSLSILLLANTECSSCDIYYLCPVIPPGYSSLVPQYVKDEINNSWNSLKYQTQPGCEYSFKLESILDELNSPSPSNGLLTTTTNIFSFARCTLSSVGLLNLPLTESSKRQACCILSPPGDSYRHASDVDYEVFVPFIKVLYSNKDVDFFMVELSLTEPLSFLPRWVDCSYDTALAPKFNRVTNNLCLEASASNESLLFLADPLNSNDVYIVDRNNKTCSMVLHPSVYFDNVYRSVHFELPKIINLEIDPLGSNIVGTAVLAHPSIGHYLVIFFDNEVVDVINVTRNKTENYSIITEDVNRLRYHQDEPFVAGFDDEIEKIERKIENMSSSRTDNNEKLLEYKVTAKQVIIELGSLYRQLDLRVDVVNEITMKRLENADSLELEYSRMCTGEEVEEITDMLIERYYEIDAQMNSLREGNASKGKLVTYAENEAVKFMSELKKNITIYNNSLVGLGSPIKVKSPVVPAGGTGRPSPVRPSPGVNRSPAKAGPALSPSTPSRISLDHQQLSDKYIKEIEELVSNYMHCYRRYLEMASKASQ